MLSRYQIKWFLAIGLSLIILALIALTTPGLYAQDADGETGDVAIPYNPSDWPQEPMIEKEAPLPEDADPDKSQQFSYSLFLPSAGSDSAQANRAAVAATWQVITYQTFEGSFPTTGWTTTDYNGASVGGFKAWDDTATKAYNSYWSAHPNDAATYVNLTDTWMRYGPFSLVGARDARFSFVYWLDSEQFYDDFTWEYACINTSDWGVGERRSGPKKTWISETWPLTRCLNQPKVWIRFRFTSDYSNPSTPLGGVWVDNIKIEKYQ